MNKRMVKELAVASLLSLVLLSSCHHDEASSGASDGSSEDVSFSYDSGSYSASLGSKTNDEAHDYTTLKVNPTSQALRDFFRERSASFFLERSDGLFARRHRNHGLWPCHFERAQ